MDPEEIKKQIAEGRANGYTDAEIKATLSGVGVDWSPEFHAPMAPPPSAAAPAKPQAMYPGARLLSGVIDAGPTAIQGATLNTAGLVSPGLKEHADKYGQDHPILGPLAEMTGAVGSAALLPGAAAAKFGARALAGGIAGGVSSAAAGEGSLTDRAKRGAVGAGIGAVAGAVLPEAGGWAARKAAKVLKPRFMPGRTIADASASIMPDDGIALMARQEQLAPGASVPAMLDPDIPGTLGVIGSNRNVAKQAITDARERLQRINTSLTEVGDQYNGLLKDRRAPLDLEKANIQRTIVKHGMMPADDIALQDVQNLRSRLRLKRKTAKGNAKFELGKDIKNLTEWLESEVPEIGALDRDYSDLMRMQKSSQDIVTGIRKSRKDYMASQMAGIEPGSPAARLPGKNGVVSEFLSPNREDLAAHTARLLLQPGQIPKELLKAKVRMASPYQPGLLGPVGIGSQAHRFTGSLFGE